MVRCCGVPTRMKAPKTTNNVHAKPGSSTKSSKADERGPLVHARTRAIHERELEVQMLLRNPMFTDEYAYRVILARCQRLRERSQKIEPSMRAYAYRLSQLFAGFAEIMYVLESSSAEHDTAEVRSEFDHQLVRIKEALDALGGAGARSREFDVITAMGQWSEVELGDVFSLVCRDQNARSVSLGEFLGAVAGVCGLDRASQDSGRLPELYRAWGSPTGPRARQKWTKASMFFKDCGYPILGADSLKTQYN